MSKFQGFCTGIVGTNGTGKSTFAEKIIKKHEKALIIVPDDMEEIFDKYPEIDPLQIPKFKKGHGKIIGIQVEDIFKIIYESHGKSKNQKKFNGILVIDDARSLTGSRDEAVRKIFQRRRQMHMNILFLCHGLSEYPVSLFPNTSNMVLFNQTDSFGRNKSRIPAYKVYERISKLISKQSIQNKYVKMNISTQEIFKYENMTDQEIINHFN